MTLRPAQPIVPNEGDSELLGWQFRMKEGLVLAGIKSREHGQAGTLVSTQSHTKAQKWINALVSASNI